MSAAETEMAFFARDARREIADKMAARGYASPLGGAGPQTPEETAEHFGREMFRLHGKNWPKMIGLASGAAMKAEHDEAFLTKVFGALK